MGTAAAPSPSSFLGAVIKGWVGEGGVEAPVGVEALHLGVGVTPVDEDGPTDHGLARRQEHYAAVVIQTDGKIVAVGGASDPTTGLTNLTLARYLCPSTFIV